MKYDIEVNGRTRQVTVTRRDNLFLVALDELSWTVSAARVGGHMLSLLLEPELGSRPDLAADAATPRMPETPASSALARPGLRAVESREISIGSDPATGRCVFGIGTLPLSVSLNTRRRFGRKDDSAQGGSGPQRIVAPMPGKVVRLLGSPGDLVMHRQPVVVIEAMKMENELRASRDGVLSEVLVAEGQSVEAGTLLAVITPS